MTKSRKKFDAAFKAKIRGLPAAPGSLTDEWQEIAVFWRMQAKATRLGSAMT